LVYIGKLFREPEIGNTVGARDGDINKDNIRSMKRLAILGSTGSIAKAPWRWWRNTPVSLR